VGARTHRQFVRMTCESGRLSYLLAVDLVPIPPVHCPHDHDNEPSEVTDFCATARMLRFVQDRRLFRSVEESRNNTHAGDWRRESAGVQTQWQVRRRSGSPAGSRRYTSKSQAMKNMQNAAGEWPYKPTQVRCRGWSIKSPAVGFFVMGVEQNK
jgi:hypothetical protein